jgi:GT2 family glycosyltransferase
MPFFNNWQLTHQRMMELYNKVQYEPCEIILVNDASTDREIDDGVGFWQKHSNSKHVIRYIKNELNQGFSFSMNRGASIAHGDVIVLLSNDVQIYDNFVAEIVDLLKENPKYFIGGEVLWHDTGWNKIGNTIFPYANGWLLACTKGAWIDIGGFDLRYGHFDYEDCDISTEAISKGYVLKALSKSKLTHIGGATIYPLYPDRQEYTKRNREKFIEKWSGKA